MEKGVASIKVRAGKIIVLRVQDDNGPEEMGRIGQKKKSEIVNLVLGETFIYYLNL